MNGTREYRYLSDDLQRQLRSMTDAFSRSGLTPASFLSSLKEVLPVLRDEPDTLFQRIEGLYAVAEQLFELTLNIGRFRFGQGWNRNKVVEMARIRPLSTYHWLTGSREHLEHFPTRRDYLNDPATSLVKLKDDILLLGGLLRTLQAGMPERPPSQPRTGPVKFNLEGWGWHARDS